MRYATVGKWRKKGRLPEARGGGAGGAPVFILEEATVLDGDLAAGYPSGLALALHWYRHATTSAERGYAISRAINGLPPDLASCFLDTAARWEERAGADV